MHYYIVILFAGRHSAVTKLQLEATEKFNMKCRLKEEEVLLLKEMKSHLLFYQQMIVSLVEDVQGMYFY